MYERGKQGDILKLTKENFELMRKKKVQAYLKTVFEKTYQRDLQLLKFI